MKSFIDILKEAKIYSIDVNGNKKLSSIDKINFHHSALQKSLGYDTVVKVSDAFHDAYKKSGNYVSNTGKNDKYSNTNIRNLISKKMDVEYPTVSVCKEGKIKFSNGAHRYAMQSRLKMEKCVVMSSESCGNSKKHNYMK